MKKHIYMFTFMYSGDNMTSYTNAFRAHDKQKVTMKDIKSAREGNNVAENYVVSSISYLGYMTVEEFQGQ